MAQITLWGSIAKNGTVAAGSGGFKVQRESAGNYVIVFEHNFNSTPALVGSQWGYGNGQSTLDNVIFPSLSSSGATVLTGDANGKYTDRNFSFIAVGDIA